MLLLATACGGNGNGEDVDPGDAPEELTIWTMGGATEESEAFFEELRDEWSGDYSDTEINVEYVPWDEAQDSITNALAGGDAPDVLEAGNDQVSNWAAQGAILDLEEYVDGWDEAEDINEEAMEYGAFEDTQYSVPLHLAVRTLIYRADWLEELGHDAPATWDELAEVAEDIEDEYGVLGFGAPTDFTNGIASFIWSNGGEVATSDDGTEWEGQLTNPATVEAIEFYTELTNDLSPVYTGEDELIPQADLANEELGMYIDGNWAFDEVADQAGDPDIVDELGAAPIPGVDGMAPAFAGGSNLTVFSTTDNPDFAFELLSTWASKDMGATWAEHTGFFPAYPELLDEPQFQEDEVAQASATQLEEQEYFPATPNWTDADFEGKIIPGAVLDIAEGANAEERLAEANEELTEVLNQETD